MVVYCAIKLKWRTRVVISLMSGWFDELTNLMSQIDIEFSIIKLNSANYLFEHITNLHSRLNYRKIIP